MKRPLNTKRKRQSGVQNEIMQAEDCLCRGQSRRGVSLPVPSSHSGLPLDYLKYMRAFASVWADRSIVQRVIAQIPWRQNIALMEQLDEPATRLWYAELNCGDGSKQAHGSEAT